MNHQVSSLRRILCASVLGGASLLPLSACDSDSAAPEDDAKGDAGPGLTDAALEAAPKKSDAGDSGEDAGLPLCNDLSLDGVAAGTIRATTEAPPDPIGGVIEDGTYVFVEYVIYGRPNAVPATPFLRSKLVVSAGVWQIANADPVKPPIRTETSQFVVSGTTLTLTKTCATAQAPQSFPYSAFTGDAGKKRFAFFNGKAEVSAFFYEKQ